MLVLCIYTYDYYGKRAFSSVMVEAEEPKDIISSFEKRMNQRLNPEQGTKMLRGPAPIDFCLEKYLPQCGKDFWVVKEKK